MCWDEHRRREDLFREYLELMDARVHEEACSSCFLVFDFERPPGQESPSRMGWGESLPRARVAGPGRTQPRHRFVQFNCQDEWFAMVLPRPTIAVWQRSYLLHKREGFFINAEVRDYRAVSRSYVRRFDPTCKHYRYGQEAVAAEDAAFLFDRIWQVPANAKILVTSATCNADYSWEKNVVLQEKERQMSEHGHLWANDDLTRRIIQVAEEERFFVRKDKRDPPKLDYVNIRRPQSGNVFAQIHAVKGRETKGRALVVRFLKEDFDSSALPEPNPRDDFGVLSGDQMKNRAWLRSEGQFAGFPPAKFFFLPNDPMLRLGDESPAWQAVHRLFRDLRELFDS